MHKYSKEAFEEHYFAIHGCYPTHKEWLDFIFSPGENQAAFMGEHAPGKWFWIAWGFVILAIVSICAICSSGR